MLKRIYHLLPERVKKTIIFTRRSLIALFFYGKGRWCPVCEKSSRKFGRAGYAKRRDAKCMRCGAVERDRLVWTYFKEMTNLFDAAPKIMLHIAPEDCFTSRLRRHLRNGYITADLYDNNVMVRMDITDIQYQDGYFDVIYCSHVLEHVQDDRKALREFNRVLKPGGWAILLVPIKNGPTIEDPSVIDPLDRRRLFGNEDHVRQYGNDYVDRLREAGFKVKITSAGDWLPERDRVLMGLNQVGSIFFCTKEATA